MENSDDASPLMAAVEDLLLAHLEPHRARVNDLLGRCAALESLLQALYAGRYRAEPERFEAVMQLLITQTRTASRKGEPMSAEELQEAAAHAATHLERFRNLVAEQIRTGH